MIIDVLVAGSANDQFYSNIAFLRRSLNWLGGDYRAARVVAALGEWDLPEVPARWQPHLRDVDIIWSNPERAPNPTYNAQHFDRFNHIRPEADVALACDADVCYVR